VRLVELQPGQQVIGALELVRGLAGEADDDVRVNGGVRHLRPDVGDQPAVFRARVPALHVGQHLVVAGLHGNLDLLAHLRQGGHRVEDAIAHVARVAGQEADAPQPLDVMHRGQEVGQVGPAAGEVLAVPVDDLPQQGDFAYALLDQPPDLRHDLPQRPAALHPAAEGDDAVGARVGAAVDDRNVRCDGRLAVQGQVPRALDPMIARHGDRAWEGDLEVTFCLRVEIDQPDRGRLRAAFVLEHVAGRGGRVLDSARRCHEVLAVQMRDQGAGIGRREEDIHEGEALDQRRIRLDAHQAPHQGNHHAGMLVLERLQRPQPADRAVFGRLPHNARVEDDDVCVRGLVRRHEPARIQFRGDPPGIGLVHLAADRPDVVLHFVSRDAR